MQDILNHDRNSILCQIFPEIGIHAGNGQFVLCSSIRPAPNVCMGSIAPFDHQITRQYSVLSVFCACIVNISIFEIFFSDLSHNEVTGTPTFCIGCHSISLDDVSIHQLQVRHHIPSLHGSNLSIHFGIALPETPTSDFIGILVGKGSGWAGAWLGSGTVGKLLGRMAEWEPPESQARSRTSIHFH